MFVSLPLLIGVGVFVLAILVLVFRGQGRDDLMGPGQRAKRPPPLRSVVGSGSPQIGPELETIVRAMMAKGEKLAAIKKVREERGLGLKDARDAVEALGR